MTEKQYLGINTVFSDLSVKNYTEVQFNTPVSILDYDAVVISTSWISSSYSSREKFHGLPVLSEHDSVCISSDFNRIKRELTEFLESGRNVFVLLSRNENCCIYTGETQYSGTGKNARRTNIVDVFNTLSFLPVKIQLEYATGDKISAHCGYPYKDFFSAQRENMYYSAYFVEEIGQPLAKIAKSDRVVASVVEYGKGKIVFLPDVLDENSFETSADWKKQGTNYLNSLFDLDCRLISPDEYILPEWTKTIYVPGEKAIDENIQKAKNKLEEAQKELENGLRAIEEKQKLKLLLSGTGKPLEDTVKDILTRIGFSVLPAEIGRADICAEYNHTPIVCEVKGLTKSAGERNAAQLEKWASMYYEDHNQPAKPLLIVNTFKDLPLCERIEDSFPTQMHPYAISRGHCLITTAQLLCMYIDISNTPEKANTVIADLLNTVGVYGKYQEYSTYLDIDSD